MREGRGAATALAEWAGKLVFNIPLAAGCTGEVASLPACALLEIGDRAARSMLLTKLLPCPAVLVKGLLRVVKLCGWARATLNSRTKLQKAFWHSIEPRSLLCGCGKAH